MFNFRTPGIGRKRISVLWGERVAVQSSQNSYEEADHRALWMDVIVWPVFILQRKKPPREGQWPAWDQVQFVTKSNWNSGSQVPLCSRSHFLYAMSNPILQGLVKGSTPERWEQERLSPSSVQQRDSLGSSRWFCCCQASGQEDLQGASGKGSRMK